MSGQWKPYKQETEIEKKSNEASQYLETDEDTEVEARHESRFKRRHD